MAISTATKLATVKRWLATLVINDVSFQLIDVPSRTLGTNQQRGTCTCRIRAFPDVPAGSPGYVYLFLNDENELFFTGIMDVRPISDNPPTYEVTLTDMQREFAREVGERLVWNGQSFSDVVRDLLNRAGIPNNRITAIHNPGEAFAIGPNYPIEIEPDTTIEALLNELMEFGGTQLLVAADGTIEVRDAPGWPQDQPTLVYAYGANKAIEEFGILSSKRTVAGNESIVSEFKAYGPRRPDKQIPDATFRLAGVTGKKSSKQYRLCQTDQCARAIAEREIVRLNRQSTEVEVSAPLNPSIRPGDSLMFRNPILGWPTNTPAIVLAVSSSGDTMTMRISVGARPAEGDVSHVPPPNASFTLRYEYQPIALAGVVAPRYVVEAISTASDPSGFSITRTEWSASCAGRVEPESSTEQRPIFVFETIENAQITLTVESSSGEGASHTQAVVPPSSEVFTRTLAVATPGGWKVLAGSVGWRSFESNCTAVPGINDTGPLLGGFSNGKLYRTDDYLATPPTLLHTFPSAVRCIFVNEMNPQHMLVGAGGGLYQSTDGGVSWNTLATFEDDINYVESSPANPNDIRVCAGRSLWHSMDGGTSFTALLTGPTGSTCRKVGSAPWGHLAVWSGTNNLDDAWKFEEGYSLNWSTVPAEHRPVDLASVTPTQYEEGFVLAAGAVSDMVRDGLYGQLTYIASISGAARFYRVMPDRSVRYLSRYTEGGAAKLVVHHQAFSILADESTAYRIGYGQPTDPLRPPQLVILPRWQSGSLDRAWHYLPDQNAWIPKMLPLSGEYWTGIAICPQNPNEWLIWGNQARVFWTGNAGATWTEIFLPSIPQGSTVHMLGVVFTGARREWAISRLHTRAYGVGRWYQSYLAFGQGPNNLRQLVLGDPMLGQTPRDTSYVQPVTALCPGYDGEIWCCAMQRRGPSGSTIDGDEIAYEFPLQAWVDPVSLTIHEVGTTVYQPADIEAPVTGRAGYCVWQNNVARITNYRATLPDPATAVAAGGWVASCQAGLFAGVREGIAQIRNITTAPEVSVVAAAGYQVGPVQAGSSRRGVAAISLTTNPQGRHIVFAHNGMTWTAIETPEGLTNICHIVGLIEP